MEAEHNKSEYGREHQKRATLYNAAEQKVSVNLFVSKASISTATWRYIVLDKKTEKQRNFWVFMQEATCPLTYLGSWHD